MDTEICILCKRKTLIDDGDYYTESDIDTTEEPVFICDECMTKHW